GRQAGTGTPPGSVSLVIDGVARAPVPLDASGRASVTLTNMPPGTHTGGANYIGDASFAPASSPALAVATVAHASSAVSITATAGTTTPGAGTPGGFVQFVIDGLGQTPVALNASGQAAVTFTTLAPGAHTAGANYFGTADFLPYSTPAMFNQTVLNVAS